MDAWYDIHMNKREYWAKRHVVVVSRRFLNKETGRMRVRVTVQTLSGKVEGTKFQDYDNMYAGDAAFDRLCEQYSQSY